MEKNYWNEQVMASYELDGYKIEIYSGDYKSTGDTEPKIRYGSTFNGIKSQRVYDNMVDANIEAMLRVREITVDSEVRTFIQMINNFI